MINFVSAKIKNTIEMEWGTQQKFPMPKLSTCTNKCGSLFMKNEWSVNEMNRLIYIYDMFISISMHNKYKLEESCMWSESPLRMTVPVIYYVHIFTIYAPQKMWPATFLVHLKWTSPFHNFPVLFPLLTRLWNEEVMWKFNSLENICVLRFAAERNANGIRIYSIVMESWKAKYSASS